MLLMGMIWTDGDELPSRWFDTTAKILRGTATVTLPSIEKNF